MASVQVMPNLGNSVASKKEQHKEAGRKRLEEFRRKKAAAKKAVSTTKQDPADAVLHQKPASVSEDSGLTNPDGSGLSEGTDGPVEEQNAIQATEFGRKSQLDSSYGTQSNYSGYSLDTVRAYTSGAVLRESDASLGIVGNINVTQAEEKSDNLRTDAGNSVIAVGIASEQSSPFKPPSFLGVDDKSSPYNNHRSAEALPNSRHGPQKDFAVSPITSSVFGTNFSREKSGSSPIQNNSIDTFLPANNSISSSYEDGVPASSFLVPDMGERKNSNSYSLLTGENGPSPWSSETKSASFSFDVGSSFSHVPWSSASNGRRSRPSFLDPVSSSSVPSAPSPAEGDNANSSSSKVYPVDVPVTSVSKNSMYSFGAINNGSDLSRHGVSEHSMEKKQEFYSAKQDDEFAALEQHIEDLTQEKFSLQRALEASRALAESLASENSALTDSYNQQGGVVHQLKLDMEMLQEELKAHMVELEAVKIEYGNIQLECNAADERAKLLASEVIGLEEKALRLRSSELKLQRELENSQAEMSSYRKKIASLEKDRQDLQSTIHALQEEKKLLQTKVRKASSSGKFVDVNRTPPNRREASTSTDDLGSDDRETGDVGLVPSNVDMPSTALDGNGASTSNSLPDNRQFTLDSVSLSIPSDQMRTIQNINTLISELVLEREELIQALSTESSQSSRLKELNKELSQKLEVQTQRLEFLTSQRMVGDYVPAKLTDSRTIHDNTAYADEGDEVVERVLGWIIKLFPGGPSKRRTSKLI